MSSSAAAWEHSHNTSTVRTATSEHTRQEAHTLWQRVEGVLANAREQRVAYLLFHCGLTPQEIVQRCTREFPEIQEVLSLRYIIMKKLVHVV